MKVWIIDNETYNFYKNEKKSKKTSNAPLIRAAISRKYS